MPYAVSSPRNRATGCSSSAEGRGGQWLPSSNFATWVAEFDVEWCGVGVGDDEVEVAASGGDVALEGRRQKTGSLFKPGDFGRV